MQRTELVETERRDDVAAWWGVTGVMLIFANAVLRLGMRGVDTMSAGLSWGQWLALVSLTAVFVYGEGVLALQMKYIPRLLERLQEVRAEPRRLPRLLAPLHALMLVYAPTATLVRAWAGVAAIALAVIIVRSFPEPWRGITDFAVAAALGWALLVLIAESIRLLSPRSGVMSRS